MPPTLMVARYPNAANAQVVRTHFTVDCVIHKPNGLKKSLFDLGTPGVWLQWRFRSRRRTGEGLSVKIKKQPHAR